MIEHIIKVPNREECEAEGFPCYDCDLRSITNCGIFRDHMLRECEKKDTEKTIYPLYEFSTTSGSFVPKVTYEDIKKLVKELDEQKKKIERLQKEFIEQELKKEIGSRFLGYILNSEKGMLTLYGMPVYMNPFIDKNTIAIQKDDGEIIKVGLPKATRTFKQ